MICALSIFVSGNIRCFGVGGSIIYTDGTNQYELKDNPGQEPFIRRIVPLPSDMRKEDLRRINAEPLINNTTNKKADARNESSTRLIQEKQKLLFAAKFFAVDAVNEQKSNTKSTHQSNSDYSQWTHKLFSLFRFWFNYNSQDSAQQKKNHRQLEDRKK